MEKQILGILNEVLEEQKEDTRLMVALNSTLNTMQSKIENLEAKIDHSRADNLEHSRSGVDDQVIKEVKEMKMWLAKIPTNVRHEKRLLLFPEHNAREYYSVVFKWIFFIIVATYTYWFLNYLASLVME